MEWLRKVVLDPRTERFIMVVIIANAVVLGLETSKTVMASYGRVLDILDNIMLGIFVVELTARIIVHRGAFFAIPGASSTSSWWASRWSRPRELQRDARAAGAAGAAADHGVSVAQTRSRPARPLPGMGSIVLLIGLIYYVFAVMATKMFGDAKPELFGTLGNSLFTLFTVMTLEGWVDGVTKPVMETHPWAWIFFIIFIVFTTFMVLNLFIGVVVNAMQAEAEKGMAAERAAEREIVHGEAEPILAEVKRLRSDLADLRKECRDAPAPDKLTS